jgi:predicted lysophospholipase L1 biosynthesis ABC-type transport system permease subunit
MTSLLAAIAFVSLMVGGIGVMNIMLVSVTERTREIGIRMAVGAQPLDIMAQFLIEALTLAAIGGVIGIGLGIGIADLLSGRFGWSMQVRTDIVLLALLVSAAVGVVFGLYPARKASRLDPIEALRYESGTSACSAASSARLFMTMMLMRRLIGLRAFDVSNSTEDDSPTTRATLSVRMPPASSARRAALARSADSSQFV